jgi:hypothetical protein
VAHIKYQIINDRNLVPWFVARGLGIVDFNADEIDEQIKANQN